jgi:hypothetical protein
VENSEGSVEIKSPLKAIRKHCEECIGSILEIKNCTSPNCKLYPFRSGKNPFRKKKEYTEEELEELRVRFKKNTGK